MQHLFIPFELAMKAKEKNFTEKCFGYYNNITKEISIIQYARYHQNEEFKVFPSAPLYQQIIDWFRKQKILIEIFPIDDWNSWSYKISAEDAMAPFFVAVQYDVEFDDYTKAMNEAISEAFELIK